MNKKDLRILFFGTPQISADFLEKIILEHFNVVGLCAQEDKPVGRKNILKPVPTKVIANKYEIPVFQPAKIKNDYDFILRLNPDVILTFAYGQIIPEFILKIPKFGALNLHGSILPKYRGAAPIQFSLLNGDKETGVTLMEMTKEMDAGKIYGVNKIKIEDDDNYSSLSKKIVESAFDCFIENLDDYLSGKNKGIEQDETLVTYTRKIEKSDEIIDFNQNALDIHNKIRALSFEPGAYFLCNNVKYKVLKSSVIDGNFNKAKIISYSKDGLVIGCKNNALKILLIKKEGKNVVNIKDFYNGHQKEFLINSYIK